MFKYVQKFGESKLQLFTVHFVSLKRYVIKVRFVSLKMFEIKVYFVCINIADIRPYMVYTKQGCGGSTDSATTTPLIRILTHPFTSQHTDTPTLIDLQ